VGSVQARCELRQRPAERADQRRDAAFGDRDLDTPFPAVRRTWAVWPADSRRQDLGGLIAAFEQPSTD
jgi:hypothetical protein